MTPVVSAPSEPLRAQLLAEPDALGRAHRLVEGPLVRRHATWLLVRLEDPNRPTTLHWNGVALGPVQAGHKATCLDARCPAVYRVLLPEDALWRGANEATFRIARHGGSLPSAMGNVQEVRLQIEYAEDLDMCVPALELCADAVDQDCDGEADQAGQQACDGPDGRRADGRLGAPRPLTSGQAAAR